MELLKDIAIVSGRIITIFPLLLFVALFMGRRSIGEMPVFDFLVILALGAVIGADIADPKIHHIPTAYSVLAIGIMQKIFSSWVIRSQWFSKLVTFEPIVVIHNGNLIHKNLKKVKYSIDNILHMLRENNVFDIADVDLAVIEGNGRLSLMEKMNKSSKNSIAYPVVREGKIDQDMVLKLDLKGLWVLDQLKKQDIQIEDIFLATINEQQELHITKYTENENQKLPPIHH